MKKNIFLIIIITLFIPFGAFAQAPQQSYVPTQTTVATQQSETNFCNPNFVGEPIVFSPTAELTLDDLLYQIHKRFSINFLMGEGIKDLPINIKSGSLPWNTLLNSQFFLSGVRAKCIGNNTIELVKSSELRNLQDTQQVNTKFIKLKFLQPTTGGNVDIAGRSSSQSSGQGCQGGGQSGGQSGGQGGSQGCGNFEKLIIEVEKILGIRSSNSSVGGGGGGGNTQDSEPKRTNRSVSQIPGRNILVVRATDEEIELINQIIERADRPPFQIVIKGLIYTANENRLRDIGIQPSAIIGTGNLNTLGGITRQGGVTPEPIDPLTGLPVPGTGLPVPGGIRSLGPGFSIPSGGNTIFGFSALIGTAQFSLQATALQQNGVISIKSRPFAIVLDGEATNLDVGRQIPILTLGQIAGQSGTLEIIKASNILAVTPHVIDDENGNPVAVNLEIQLESNEVDLSVISQGIPSIARRSIQSRLILNQDKTVILGGFTVDSISNTVTKTPGLGDIPILGNLFKRTVRSIDVNRLYFAISVEIVPYGSVIEPVQVPGATTDIPSVSPPVLKIEKKP